MIDYLKFYAQNGWQVFPLKPRDKTPKVKWADVATSEENMLVGIWEAEPTANVGIACGARSGLVVLDVDPDHDGYYSLRDLQEKYGDLPETPTIKTGGGGEHFYFKHPGFEIRNSAGKLGAGLDIRGDGGYVVAAPSIHPNGNRYEWSIKPSQKPLAEMPAWMIELLQEKQAASQPLQSGSIINGSRNDSLAKLAGTMRRKGLSEEAIFAALKVFNLERCAPPLPEGEVKLIAKSISRYNPEDEIKVVSAVPNAWDVIETMEAEIIERGKNPVDVWGIHYAWPFISLITGGKQKGELIIGAGEPGVGKSWFFHQDALFTAIGNPDKKIPSTPTLIWSGEMSRKQVYRRFFEMMGVPKRKMLTGTMTPEDWDKFNEAKAVIMNSPIYVSDAALDIKGVKAMLEREQGEHGVEQVLFDYDWLIRSYGTNEIEQSQNISREMKNLSRELNLAIVLISSVNKGGMDTLSENVSKSSLSGSGKKIHDADVIYILTKFNEGKNKDLSISPHDYQKITSLHIKKGRDLDYHVPDGMINYQREGNSPKFKELRDLSQPLPAWLDRKDLA